MSKYICLDEACFFENNKIVAIDLGVSKMDKKAKNKTSFTSHKRYLSPAQIKYLMDKKVSAEENSVCGACSSRLNKIIRDDTTYAANKAVDIM
jgi:hypothetical protein